MRSASNSADKFADYVTDLALTISGTAKKKEFQVPSILLILVITIYFCHSLIRLGMLAFKSPRIPILRFVARHVRDDEHSIRPGQRRGMFEENVELQGYSNGGGDKEKVLAPPPPVYGLWRGSVVSGTS